MDPAVLRIQQTLNDEHNAGLKEDGIMGPATRDAIAKWQTVVVNNQLTDADKCPVDGRSETNIATLLPLVQPLMRAVVNRINAQLPEGETVRITSATRTYEQQNALYNQRPKVTNAPGGYSNHNFGLACDFTFFFGATPKWEGPEYHNLVGKIGKGLGLFWGGDWTSIDDEPHLEYRPVWAHDLSESAMLAQLRARRADSQDLLT